VIAVYSSASPVIVVGAGPAGATAARALAGGGMAVRLPDRAAFPRKNRSQHRHCRCRGRARAHLAGDTATRAITQLVLSFAIQLRTRSPILAGRLAWEQRPKNLVSPRAPRSRI